MNHFFQCLGKDWPHEKLWERKVVKTYLWLSQQRMWFGLFTLCFDCHCETHLNLKPKFIKAFQHIIISTTKHHYILHHQLCHFKCPHECNILCQQAHAFHKILKMASTSSHPYHTMYLVSVMCHYEGSCFPAHSYINVHIHFFFNPESASLRGAKVG